MFAILAEALPVRHSSVHNLGCLNCNTVFREVKLLTIILKDYNLETSTAGPAVKSKEDMSSKCTMCTSHMPLFNPDLCAGSKKSAIWHSWVTLWKVLCLFVLQTGSDYCAASSHRVVLGADLKISSGAYPAESERTRNNSTRKASLEGASKSCNRLLLGTNHGCGQLTVAWIE